MENDKNGFLTVGRLIEKLQSLDPKKSICAIKSHDQIFDVYDVIIIDGDIYIDLQ